MTDTTDEPEHSPECTSCVHDCLNRRRRWANGTPHYIALGAPTCRVCEDHTEAQHEGHADGRICTCCALRITNGDESGCRDFHNHTDVQHPMTGPLFGANVVLSCISTCEEHTEDAIGSCDVCGGDPGGYWRGHTVVVIKS